MIYIIALLLCEIAVTGWQFSITNKTIKDLQERVKKLEDKQ